MPLIAVAMKHGRTLDEARRGLERVIVQLQTSFGPLVQQVQWQPGRERVKVSGTGFTIEMHVDESDLHLAGDIPLLSQLLGDRVLSGIKSIVQDTFKKPLLP